MSDEPFRCVGCGNANLNRLEMRTRAVEDRTPQGIGARICRFCNIIYSDKNSKLRFWNGKEVVEVKT